MFTHIKKASWGYFHLFIFGIILLFFTKSFLVAQDTLKICALRVEFVEDNNPLTTGNGKFMIDTVTTDTNAIDPAPHLKGYFQDQIRAVANYFKKASSGRLIISGDVYPAGDSAAYQLPHEMGYYNPNRTDEEIHRGLSNLLVDAVRIADSLETGLNFSDYDLVVVFHAGVGKDINLGYDPTPQDIPSLFLSLDFMQKVLEPGFEGIPVKDGLVTQGILLPETENQQGEAVALTGIFASNIGSYLGLYDLFSPSKQRSGIGRFGLMDFGLLNLNGLAPAMPSAFSRQLLGWDQPRVVNSNTSDITLQRLDRKQPFGPPTMVRIPINEDEYYLLEYRGVFTTNVDSEYAVLAEEKDKAPTYLEVLKTFHADEIEISENGVLLSLKDYDMGLPGGGILIWHIDERVIRESANKNAINDDPENRAVDLEEADGAQDIGQVYGLLDAGFQTELGWAGDFWFANRPKGWKNFDLYNNEFSVNSTPNTRANRNRANTHITIHNFSDNTGDVMTFDYQRDFLRERFPQKLFADSVGDYRIVAATPVNKTAEYLFILTDKGRLYAVGDSGKGLFYNNKTLLADLGKQSERISLVMANYPYNEGTYSNAVVALDDTIYVFTFNQDFLQDSLLVPEKTIGLPAPITSPLVRDDLELFAACANDSLYGFNIINGQKTSSAYRSSGHRDFVIYPGMENEINATDDILYAAVYSGLIKTVLYGSGNNRFYLGPFGDLTDVPSFPAPAGAAGSPAVPTGQFTLDDLDGNDTYDILYNAADGIYALNLSGSLLNNFPLRPALNPDEYFVGSPLIYRKERTGRPVIVAATSQGQILAYDLNGEEMRDFPLSCGGRLLQSPVLLDMDADGNKELAAITDEGSLYVWNVAAPAPYVAWAMAEYGPENNVWVTKTLIPDPFDVDLLPQSRAYNYPNPNQGGQTTIRYYLNNDAQVRIRIFDTAGTLVDEFNAPGVGHTDNEVVWDVSNVASGVYLCHIEAVAGDGKQSRIIKIMVVH